MPELEITIVGEDKRALDDDPWRALRESGLPPCLGKHYAKTVRECRECLAPVIYNERISLMNEVCEAICDERRGR